MANAVKPVSKQANTRFRPFFCNGTSNRLKKTSKVLKKRMKKEQKPGSKPANLRFWPYLGNGSSDRHKKPSKNFIKER